MKILSSLFSLLSSLFNVQKNYIFFIPDVYNELISENLSNYTSQNPFIILREILRDEHFDSYTVIYQYSSDNELLSAKNSIKEFGALDRFIFLQKDTRKFRKTLRLTYFVFRSRLILSTSPLIPYKLKHSNQTHVALNYYSPFKSDMKWKLASNSIDYVVSTSLLASYIDSQASSIPVSQYKILGFPRNDYLISPRFSREEALNRLGLNIAKNYILYLPTHRVGNFEDSDDNNLVVGITDNNSLDVMLGEINA
ncbi:CDP-glycerol glycerophosphotransferase family protein, partial [bacterium]|nr:CDP-glycerol glycerophosphotransferase family protein [bacterium]